MNEEQKKFLIERYKYVLSQKQNLNGATFQVIKFYQTGFALVVAGQFAIVAAVKQSKLDIGTARGGCYTLIGLMAMLSLCTLSLLASGIQAWLNYRKEEADLEVKFTGVHRSAPTIRDAASWYETYFVIAVIALTIAYVCLALYVVVPRLA